MPPSHPTFEVIAFHAPVVERGVVRQVVHTDSGLFTLTAPAALWHGAAAAIGRALDGSVPATVRKAPASPWRGKRVTPARLEQYRAAWCRYIGEERITLAALAAECGLSLPTLARWFKKFRTEPGAPALKPKGKIA